MCIDISLTQTSYGSLAIACAAGGVTCVFVFVFALCWELSDAWQRASYERALRRYRVAQEALRVAWRA